MISGLKRVFSRFDNGHTIWERVCPFVQKLQQCSAAKWIAVLLPTLFLVRFFFTNHFIGGRDAAMYAHYLMDAIAQARAGYFPVYAGQSEFNSFGVPYVQSPYYYHFGIAIDFITGRSLSPVFIQHLTVILSICAGALVMYRCLSLLFPKLGWHLVGLSILYVSCPGVIGLIYTYDMYWSTMTIPYVPILMYGLVRLSRCGDLPAAIAIGASLAVLWPCHPPIALWCTTIALGYTALFLVFNARSPSQWGYALLPFALLPILNCWHFISVFKLGIQSFKESKSSFFVQPSFVINLMREIRGGTPGAFLPVQGAEYWVGNLQLGYAFWFLVISATVLALKRTLARTTQFMGFSECTLFLVCFWFLIALLYPLPTITESLWSFAPRIYSITRIWPMERFYVFLAALSAIIAAHFLDWMLVEKTPMRRFLSILVAILYGWAILESSNFAVRARNMTVAEEVAPQILPENMTNETNETVIEPMAYFADIHDPCLENRLFDRTLYTELESNQPKARPEFVLEDFPSIKSEYAVTTFSSTSSTLLELEMRLHPGRRYALTYDLESYNFDGYAAINSNNILQREYRSFILQRVITAWTSGAIDKDIVWTIIGRCAKEDRPGTLILRNIRVYSYSPENLPISIKSSLPYIADVIVKTPSYLETTKYCFSGYRALVNGKEVEVLRSVRGMIMIPLDPGPNHVVLVYRGAVIMRLAFFVSLAAWIALAIASWNYYFRKQGSPR